MEFTDARDGDNIIPVAYASQDDLDKIFLKLSHEEWITAQWSAESKRRQGRTAYDGALAELHGVILRPLSKKHQW